MRINSLKNMPIQIRLKAFLKMLFPFSLSRLPCHVKGIISRTKMKGNVYTELQCLHVTLSLPQLRACSCFSKLA